MDKVISFRNFKDQNIILEKKVELPYSDVLNPSFWTEKESKDGEVDLVFDERVRKKLIRISRDFFENFKGIFKTKDIIDIQLTGSLASYNYTNLSDLDVQIIVDLKFSSDDNINIIKEAIDGIRFRWNLSHDISIRGYDLEMYIQEPEKPHTGSGLFSLLKNKWIKNPVYGTPEIDELDIDQKYNSIVYQIEQLETRLVSISSVPSDAKQLYQRALNLKKKLIKMRKESSSGKGEFSVGNLAYKKLKSEGYIEKLINLISKSYNKIYTEK